jgi:hypothetical protein
MNERIRKLAEQAGATLNEGFDGNKNFVYAITTSPEELKKFAELIVRECMDNLAWHGHDEAVSQLDWFLHHKIRS